MLKQHNTPISTKALRAAKENLGQIIEGTALLSGWLQTLTAIADETGSPALDASVLSDCNQMLVVINRLMYQEKSRLSHLQMMQIVSEKASMQVAVIRPSGVAESREPSLFNHAI